MADLYGNSPSKYHLIFNCKPSNSGNIAVLSYIKSIWEDKHIEKLKDNQWKCLWCDVRFQGINAKKISSSCYWNQNHAHKEMYSFSWWSLFINIQGVTANQSCQEKSSKRLFTKNDLFHITLTGKVIRSFWVIYSA